MDEKKLPTEKSGERNKTIVLIAIIQLLSLIVGIVMLGVREHEAFQDFWILSAVIGLLKIPD